MRGFGAYTLDNIDIDKLNSISALAGRQHLFSEHDQRERKHPAKLMIEQITCREDPGGDGTSLTGDIEVTFGQEHPFMGVLRLCLSGEESVTLSNQ